MIRKFIVVLIAGTICLIGAGPLLAVGEYPGGNVEIYPTLQAYEEATGKRIEIFDESPMLTEEVAAGELPSVEERLPEEPMVLDPAVRIGKYGGALRMSWVGMEDAYAGIVDVIYEFPLTYSSEAPMESIEPNIFKSWEISEGGRVFTFHVREGMKWSDGQPFTADDFMFWYEDIALNKELSPQPHFFLMMGEEVGEWEKIDKYTIRMSWSKPYGQLLERLSRWRPVPYAPKHYLKEFHPNYTPMDEIEKIVGKEGYTIWTDLFRARMEYYRNPETPTICAWVQVSKGLEPLILMKRNPYYWKIDTEGNQLPYIDFVERGALTNQEALVLKAVAGRIDLCMDEIVGGLENITILKKNEEKGGYKIVPSMWNVLHGTVEFNMSHEDPVLRKLFRDKRFRIALSVAEDREEINNIVYKGLYMVSQTAPPIGPPFYGDRPRFKVYTDYEPEFANYLLDKVGLDKWNAGHTIRLRPDGKPLELVLSLDLSYAANTQIAEMLKKQWEDVGVAITIKPIAGELWEERKQTGMYELGMRGWNSAGGTRPMFGPERDEMVPISALFQPNWAWGLWYQTEGKEGEEPPPAIKELHELSVEFVSTLDRERKIQIEREVDRIHADNLWMIATLKCPGTAFFHVITNRLKNVRKPCPFEMNPAQPSTWYIEE